MSNQVPRNIHVRLLITKGFGVPFKPMPPEEGKSTIGLKDFHLCFKVRVLDGLKEGIQRFIRPTPLDIEQAKQPIPIGSNKRA